MRARSCHRLAIAVGVGALLSAAPAAAAPPTGNLDLASPTHVGGWARDPDHPGPIAVHVYIDGEIAHGFAADALRPDLPFPDQDHGFGWVPPLLGPGTHTVDVYAIGVDASGVPDGENPPLPSSPGFIADGCNGLPDPASWWCAGVPAYYEDRAADTEYLFSDTLRAGINTSYGGTVFELYGPDHSRNLLAEHGGGAVQLSVWGYEPLGAAGWFADGDGVCDPVPYPSEAACLAAGHASCRIWAHSGGAHVADCASVQACGWGAGAPFNPIQAQAAGCGWDSPTNDVDLVITSAGQVHVEHGAPYHFTQTNSMAGVTFEQTATLGDAWLRLDYHLTYTGPWTLVEHPQEIPALFPGDGMHASYSYYAGGSPWTDPASPVTTVAAPPAGLMLRLDGRGPWPHPSWDDVITEYWVSACDAAQQHCLTVAVFSEQYKEIDCAASPGNGYGYLTPLGGFALVPGLDEQFTAFLFPGRWDDVLAGQTVRWWIHQLAATELPPGDDDDAAPDDDDAGDDDVAPDDDDAAPDDDDSAPDDDDARPADDDAGPDDDDDAPDDDDGAPDDDDSLPPIVQDCGCRAGPAPAAPALLLALVVTLARRRPPGR